MLDMNCDGMLCETDLFTFMELHKEESEFFRTTLIYDLQDISQALRERNAKLVQSNTVMDFSDARNPKIKNLGAYLETTRARAEQRKNILGQDFFSQLNKTPGPENKST